MISDIPLIVWGFVSLLVFPFMGLLSVVKIRATPYLVTLLVIWAIIGLFIVGGGIITHGTLGYSNKSRPERLAAKSKGHHDNTCLVYRYHHRNIVAADNAGI